jgi:hypothetical protein
MRKLSVLLACVCALIGAAIVVDAQQGVKLVTAAGADVPLSTTSELTHGATAPTWTAVVGNVPMAHGSATRPTAVTANQPVAPWRDLYGAQPSISVADENPNGCTPNRLISAASTNATSVKASAGSLYEIHASNLNAAARYLKLYNKASAPTVGTDTPVQVIGLAPSSANAFSWSASVPMAFTTGIAFAVTSGITDADTGAISASETAVSYCYK